MGGFGHCIGLYALLKKKKSKGQYTPANICKQFANKLSSCLWAVGGMFTNIQCFLSPVGSGKQDTVCKHVISPSCATEEANTQNVDK